MESFDQVVQTFLENKEQPLPRITLGVVNKSGTLKYVKSFGEELEGPEGETSDGNGIYWIASCTKFITTIAALQCVDKGLLTLDGDISKVLPEWKDPKILIGHDEKKQPIFRPAKNTITLRQLLTHSAGMAYGFTSALVREYRQNRGELDLLHQTIAESYPLFLVSEPGTEWRYSPAIDWAGKMIERATHKTLDDYITTHIFQPLNITDATFHLPAHPALQCRRLKVWQRTHSGPLEQMQYPLIPSPMADAHGGAGLYASAPALLAVYAAALRRDTMILQPDTWASMFKDQLQTTDGKGLSGIEHAPKELRNNVLGSIPNGASVGFGFGGVVCGDGLERARAEGSMSWSGFPNCYWWIDPKQEVAGVYLSQLLPSGDDKSIELLREFELAVYKATAEGQQ